MKTFFSTLAAILAATLVIVVTYGAIKIGLLSAAAHAEQQHQQAAGAQTAAVFETQTQESLKKLEAMPTAPPIADEQAAFDRKLSSIEFDAETAASPAPTASQSPQRK